MHLWAAAHNTDKHRQVLGSPWKGDNINVQVDLDACYEPNTAGEAIAREVRHFVRMDL
jgi:hypothetical protein